MNTSFPRVGRRSLLKTAPLFAASALLALPLFSQESNDEEEEIFELSPFTVEGSTSGGYRATSSMAGTRIRTNLSEVGSAISGISPKVLADLGELGATVGGAQDMGLFRLLVERGHVPPSDSFTPEGLFSEHDLPIAGHAQPGFLFDLAAQAMPFESAAQPEVEVLAQLGFVSGIDAASFRPRPLNLVAVVDKSGSMSGEPLELARKSLRQILSQLGSDDQLSIVLYGSSTHLHLPPTPTTNENKSAIAAAIDSIASSGSTYMEAGLRLGYETARSSGERFEGATRVMLFTDEQPNVGRTDADSFMSMAETASLEGIGLTTIGVGAHFGSELAEKISSVRGGNLFFFEDAGAMEETFRKDFDTMALELAYEMELEIAPAAGVRIAGLYGIPGDMVEWREDGSLSLGIATIFASRNKGAIYFGMAATEGQPALAQRDSAAPLAHLRVRYVQADNGAERDCRLALAMTPPAERQPGLIKGGYLANQYTSFKLATLLYEQGEYAAAAETANRFARQSPPLKDPGLNKEAALAAQFAARLADDCRARDLSLESPRRAQGKDALIGDWIEESADRDEAEREIIRFNADGMAELYASSAKHPLRFLDETPYRANWWRIEFVDWSRAARYRIRDGQLEMRDGGAATRYRRRSAPSDVERSGVLRALQREAAGLPSEQAAALAATR